MSRNMTAGASMTTESAPSALRRKGREAVTLVRCINCRKRRRCLLVEIYSPFDDWHERVGGVHICRECMRADIGTLAHFLLKCAR